MISITKLVPAFHRILGSESLTHKDPQNNY
jgi:hypothetical protein